MKRRPYVLKARGAAKQETHQRILQAGADLWWEKGSPDSTLDDVAQRSGVSAQTILRHFGTRERLFAAVEDFLHQQVIAERQAPAGDVQEAVSILFDHYERRGDAVLRLLGQEYWNARIRARMDSGRRAHREWVEGVFAPLVRAGQGPEVEREELEELLDLLVVATDVYTWKLLRRDRLLDRQQAEDRVKRLIAAILAGKTGTTGR
jgi:AcrR family transcriptional regulator